MMQGWGRTVTLQTGPLADRGYAQTQTHTQRVHTCLEFTFELRGKEGAKQGAAEKEMTESDQETPFCFSPARSHVTYPFYREGNCSRWRMEVPGADSCLGGSHLD